MLNVLKPMLASLEEAPLVDPQFVYEPKYDGIRAIVDASARGTSVRIWSRLGNEKTAQFPDVADAIRRWARRRRVPVVLDGEIVALDERGEPTGFQRLQGRIHVKEQGGVAPAVAFVAFDLLAEGSADLRDRPLTARRAALERIFGRTGSPILRISEQVAGDGRAMHARAVAGGWEGLIAKRAASRYLSGKRSSDWRKLKIQQEQEFVIGGWTDPRQSRAHFGALLLGVYDAPHHARGRDARRLTYAGHVGTGFDARELDRLTRLMRPLEVGSSPFDGKVPTNERPHWVQPALVAQVRFTEWTDDGVLRHPVYLGLRDDKRAGSVTRESRKTSVVASAHGRNPHSRPTPSDTAGLLDALQAIETSRRDGQVTLPDGGSLRVSNLHKVFWPRLELTKGDLFRYYVKVAPALLPVLADRPLVMKRFPNGVDAKPFYQHRAEHVPDIVRTETLDVSERRQHVIGGDLATLIYTTQLAAISQDPFFSRAQSLHDADFVAFDLDPSEGVPFQRVLDVARWIRDELDVLGAPAFAKTSGADGLHVYVPLPPRTSYEAAQLFAQIVATVVTHKHPKAATVERAVRARGSRIYIDCLQNALGKTLASAYSARASRYAGVSTPLTWQEIDDGVRREDFTIVTVPARLAAVGDLWAGLAASAPADLARVSRYSSTHRPSREAK